MKHIDVRLRSVEETTYQLAFACTSLRLLSLLYWSLVVKQRLTSYHLVTAEILNGGEGGRKP